MPNSAVKIAPSGRWTPQERGAFYLSRYASTAVSLGSVSIDPHRKSIDTDPIDLIDLSIDL